MTTAKTDSESLMTAAVDLAELLLLENGEFYPFGFAMKPDGEIISISAYDGDEFPPSNEIADLLNESFRDAATNGDFRATALTVNARVTLPGTKEKSDAVAVSLDHQNQYSVVVFWPYTLSQGEVSFGEIFAQQGTFGIFPEQ